MKIVEIAAENLFTNMFCFVKPYFFRYRIISNVRFVKAVSTGVAQPNSEASILHSSRKHRTAQTIHSRTYSVNTHLNKASPESFNDFRVREELKEQLTFKEHDGQSPNNSSCNSGENIQEYDAETAELKRSILKVALEFVPTHGWSRQALAKGAESINFPSVTNGLFQTGGMELVHYFNKRCNERLVEHLKQETIGVEKLSDPALFARKAIEVRLRMLIPYIKHWPQALGLMTLPPNVPTSLANILTMVDDICWYAGDRSVDFNWYIRRIGLAGIYKATELYMLQDTSVDYEKTWKFLERRFNEASVMYDFLIKSDDATAHFQNAVGTAFSTARNILGINFERR